MRLFISVRRWLEKEPENFNIGLLIVMAAIILPVTYDLLLLNVFVLNGEVRVEKPDPIEFCRTFVRWPQAFVEEAGFRAPVGFLLRPPHNSRTWIAVSIAIIASTFGFAMVHPQSPHPFILQGVGGLVLTCVFLKFGGARGEILRPLAISTLVHMAHNFILFTIEAWLILRM